MSPPKSEGPVYISSITLDVPQKFWTTNHTVDHITIGIGDFKRKVLGELSPGKKYNEVFEPALTLLPRDQLSVSMQYQSRSGGRTHNIAVQQIEVVTEARVDRNGEKVYVNSHKNILLTIGVKHHCYDISAFDTPSDRLPWTTNRVLPICPRFRLLVIANASVGKSTLIQKVFGINDNISESSRGRADIDHKFITTKNKLLALHLSPGLETGNGTSLDKVKHFIDKRRQNVDVKDRLHAVWVCLEVPQLKKQLLEVGVKEFLRDRRKILGHIPIIVVLTKSDLLDNLLLEKLREDGVEVRRLAPPELESHRARFLDEYLKKPLQQVAEGDIPHVAVSTSHIYKSDPTISELVKTTISEIQRYFESDSSYRSAPLYVAGMAQRASIEEKVDLTTRVGQKKDWGSFGRSFKYSSNVMRDHLVVIRQDIIQVWNLHDPEMILLSNGFILALLDISSLRVEDLDDRTTRGPEFQSLASELGPLIVSSFGAAVTIPVTEPFALTQKCGEIVKEARDIKKCFMAYIADLIYVMKILFVLTPRGSITPEDAALALEVYNKSTHRNRVHSEILDLRANYARGDVIMDKIGLLIKRYHLTDEDVSRVRGEIHAAGGFPKRAIASS